MTRLNFLRRLPLRFGSRTQTLLSTAMADRGGNSGPACGVHRVPRAGAISILLCGSRRPGDFVIHFNDGVIVGWSRVAGPFQETDEAPPNPAQWAGRSLYYRIPLTDYQDFPNKVPLSEFIVRHHDALVEELRTDAPKRFPFIIYNDTIRRAQGAYLTRCTPKLYDLIRNEVYLEDDMETFDPVRPHVEKASQSRGADSEKAAAHHPE